MGNQILETNNQSKELEKLLSRFHIIQNDTVKNFILLEEITTHQEFTLKQITTNDQIQKKNIENMIQKKLIVKCPYISKLESYLIQKQKNYCSNQFKTYLLFESHTKNLKYQIAQRRHRKLTFNQSQIINIIESGVFALKFLNEINHAHQAICSANIFFNKEGNILISDPWLNQQHIPFPSTNHIYLSPQKLDQINNLRLQKVEWFTSDLFSLGIVILEVINLEFMDQLYLRNHKQLNRLLLKQKIAEVKSNVVKNYLEILLLTDPFKRIQILNEISINRMKIQHQKQKSKSREKVIRPLSHNNSAIKLRMQQPSYEKSNNQNIEVVTKELSSVAKKLDFNERKAGENSALINNNSHQQHLKLMINNRHNNNQNLLTTNNQTKNQTNNTNQFIQLHHKSSNHNVKFNPQNNNIQMKNVSFMKDNHQNTHQNQQQKFIQPTITTNNNNRQIKINFINHHNRQNNVNIVNAQQKIINNTISSNPNNANIMPYNPFLKITETLLPKTYYTIPTVPQNNDRKNNDQHNQVMNINNSISNSIMNVNSSINNPNSFINRSTINSNPSSISSKLSQSSNPIDSQINIIDNKKNDGQRQSQQIKPDAILQTDHSYVNTSLPKLEYSNINDNELSDQKYLLSYEMEPTNQKIIESCQQSHESVQEKITTPARRNKNINKYNSTIQQVSQKSGSPDSVINQPEFILQQYDIGSKYQGYKKNGMRNGKGTFYYQDGGYYEGQWKDNKMHGYGKLYYSQFHLAYEGDWYMDQFHGHGKVYNDNPVKLDIPFDYRNFDQLEQYWQYYEGNLIKDTKEGLGIIKLSNGEMFEGEFHEDKIEGKGKYTTMNGEIINGIWENSKLQKIIDN